jgi:ABC-2 type transport system ATP-binding protein
MLSSDLLPTSGSMKVDGIDLVDRPEQVRPKIGYLPDRPPLYGEMTVREYLDFVARLKGMPKAKIKKRIDEVIDITDVGEYADERIDTLSHGFRQRVGIAQAIVHEPHLLLLDEPISGLDPVQIVEMRELIRSLRGVHTTVLSSHILSEISETCDRLLVIRDGEIVASGSEEELSAQMATVSSFELTMRLPEGDYRSHGFDAARNLLQKVQGVQATIQLGATSEDGVVTAQVGAASDVRELAVRALVNEGFGILRLEPAGGELEDVFLQLTGMRDEHRLDGAGRRNRGGQS